MTPDATADGIAALVEGVTIQDALVHHRQALAWGQQVCTPAAADLAALEAYEPVAYEDRSPDNCTSWMRPPRAWAAASAGGPGPPHAPPHCSTCSAADAVSPPAVLPMERSWQDVKAPLPGLLAAALTSGKTTAKASSPTLQCRDANAHPSSAWCKRRS